MSCPPQLHLFLSDPRRSIMALAVLAQPYRLKGEHVRYLRKYLSGDRRLFHVHAVAMIDVIQMAPERAIPHSARHTEVGLGARRRARNPAAASQEVVTEAARDSTGDPGRR